MAELTPNLPRSKGESIPFWRDIRVLGVLAQIAFVVVFILAATWVIRNVLGNLDELGEAQFICADGGSSFRCAFDFLNLEAQFDIAEKPIAYTPADSYWRALSVGLLNTIKVAVLGIILATILGAFTGIARLSSNWLIRTVSKWYVDIIRQTPLLLQLFFLYFGVLLTLPQIRQAHQFLGLPVYLSQRGINLAWPVIMPSFTTWLAFLVLGLAVAAALWLILGRLEQRLERSANRSLWVTLAFLLAAGAGWVVTGSRANNLALLVAPELAVSEFDELQAVARERLQVEDLSQVDELVAQGTLSEETVEAAALKVCVLEDTPAETAVIAELQQASIPFQVDSFDDPDEATEAYAAGDCQVFAAGAGVIGGARGSLENPNAHQVVNLPEQPLRLSAPRLQGLNFVGGVKLTPEFAAILIGLVIYTGAFIAEIVRAGIQSVAKGQSEAARALGLTEAQRLRLIVLPQALRVIIPPLTSQYLNLTKNSTLALAVAFPDLWSISYTTINQSGRAIQIILIIMVTYLSLSLLISAFLNWYNRRIALVER
ncbi:MAG: ABC transporter permease subunit [Chloroflexi bacterium]|nr:ABC transporter permease subunit [Chloroflexota bacterium]MCI0580553.1 ABC transporter permease subunit [Chloroflexota bacterium]MCI0647690.1 ABC transporter permease subunit [Chloroflexota bacterium]MCI0726581.1 ABC transporter permease subunit [Chloroflexota bacterium]